MKQAGSGTDTLNEFQVRSLTRGDLAEVQRLHATREDLDSDGARKRTELLEWLAFHNPFASPGEVTYYVAELEGKIVAYHGRMPVRFVINGSIENGSYVHDLYVDPVARRRGLGVALTLTLAHIIEESTPNFFCLSGMTPTNLLMQRRRNYLELVAQSYMKRISILDDAERYLGSGTLSSMVDTAVMQATRILDRVASLATPGGNVTTRLVSRFGPEIDSLNDRVLPKLGICTLRTSAYLNWKYADRPYPRESLLLSERKGAISGYAVVGLSPYKKLHPVGMILDLIADPDDSATISSLIRGSVDHLRSMNAQTVRCIMSDERFARILRRLLFTREKVGQTIMLGNLDKSSFQSQLKDLKHWHMTRSESDCFMLSP